MNGSSPAPVLNRPSTIYRSIGLSDDPFPLDPLAGAWVPLPDHVRMAATISAWLAAADDAQSGIAVISGDAGSGKTRLLDRLAGTLVDSDDRLLGVVPDDGSRRSDAQLLRAAISALGGTSVGRTGLELTTELRAILTEHRGDALPPVVLIDNAALTGSQLEILRNVLAPIQQDGMPMRVQIVLFGPPELPDRIARRRSLAGFLRDSARFEPLDLGAMGTLLQSRIDAVRDGSVIGSPVLSGTAIEIIWQTASGNPGTAIAIAHAAIREVIATRSQVVSASLVQAVVTNFASQVARAARADSPIAPFREDVVQTRLSLPGVDEGPEQSPATRRRRRQQ